MDSQFPSINAQPSSTVEQEQQAAAPFEPFYEDWRQAPASQAALVLSNRQLAIVGFLLTAAMTLMSALAYVAGRASSNASGSVLMVETAQQAKAPTQPPAPGADRPSPAATSAPTSAASPATDSTISDKVIAQASPVPRGAKLPVISGESYWQVGALDAGMAEVSRKYLEDNALPVRLEAIAGTTQMRVMVGPAAGEQVDQIRERLVALGFQPFLKRF